METNVKQLLSLGIALAQAVKKADESELSLAQEYLTKVEQDLPHFFSESSAYAPNPNQLSLPSLNLIDEEVEEGTDLSIRRNRFISAFNDMATSVHQTAVSKGWWDSSVADMLDEMAAIDIRNENTSHNLRKIAHTIRERNDGEMIALIQSEASEALEALRLGNPPDDKIPEFSGVEAEFADVIIRIMDLSARRGWRVAEALVAKAQMNTTRAYKHGKNF
jgi:hypothetical protein